MRKTAAAYSYPRPTTTTTSTTTAQAAGVAARKRVPSLTLQKVQERTAEAAGVSPAEPGSQGWIGKGLS